MCYKKKKCQPMFVLLWGEGVLFTLVFLFSATVGILGVCRKEKKVKWKDIKGYSPGSDVVGQIWKNMAAVVWSGWKGQE